VKNVPVRQFYSFSYRDLFDMLFSVRMPFDDALMPDALNSRAAASLKRSLCHPEPITSSLRLHVRVAAVMSQNRYAS
jgi:hypothetical protein